MLNLPSCNGCADRPSKIVLHWAEYGHNRVSYLRECAFRLEHLGFRPRDLRGRHTFYAAMTPEWQAGQPRPYGVVARSRHTGYLSDDDRTDPVPSAQTTVDVAHAVRTYVVMMPIST